MTLARLLYQAKIRPARIRTMIMGVRKEWQGRRIHHAMLLNSYIDQEVKSHIEQCDMSLLAESNTPILNVVQLFGAEKYKTWRLYEREI